MNRAWFVCLCLSVFGSVAQAGSCADILISVDSLTSSGEIPDASIDPEILLKKKGIDLNLLRIRQRMTVPGRRDRKPFLDVIELYSGGREIGSCVIELDVKTRKAWMWSVGIDDVNFRDKGLGTVMYIIAAWAVSKAGYSFVASGDRSPRAIELWDRLISSGIAIVGQEGTIQFDAKLFENRHLINKLERILNLTKFDPLEFRKIVRPKTSDHDL